MSSTIKEELAAISQKNNGLLRPEDVVRFARNKKTKLHSRFEWDNGKAAHQYRLWQARHIINVEVTMLQPDQPDGPVRAYISLPDSRGKSGGYREITAVISAPELRESMLSMALEEMSYFRRKYHTLKMLSEVFSAMEKVESKVKSKKRKAA